MVSPLPRQLATCPGLPLCLQLAACLLASRIPAVQRSRVGLTQTGVHESPTCYWPLPFGMSVLPQRLIPPVLLFPIQGLLGCIHRSALWSHCCRSQSSAWPSASRLPVVQPCLVSLPLCDPLSLGPPGHPPVQCHLHLWPPGLCCPPTCSAF